VIDDRDAGAASLVEQIVLDAAAREDDYAARHAGDHAVVAFDHADGGLMVGKKDGLADVSEVQGGTLAGFAVSGTDKKWHWAQARIEGATVVVRSDAVPAPTAVRYASFSNPVKCNLYNRAGLPAAPFRTDAK